MRSEYAAGTRPVPFPVVLYDGQFHVRTVLDVSAGLVIGVTAIAIWRGRMALLIDLLVITALALTLTLWARSYRGDRVSMHWRAERATEIDTNYPDLTSQFGGLSMIFKRVEGTTHPSMLLYYASRPNPGILWEYGNYHLPPEYPFRSGGLQHARLPKLALWGLEWTSDSWVPDRRVGRVSRGWSAVAPHWMICTALCLWPAWRMMGVIRCYWRRARGRCVRCAYDVRASTDRCPECGYALSPQVSRRKADGLDQLPHRAINNSTKENR